MATANLNLTTINLTDQASPATINENFVKVDAVGKRYVTSKGVTSGWTWQKWSDKLAECWIEDKAFSSQASMDAWGTAGFYRTPTMTFGAFPFSFAARPYVDVKFNSSASSTQAVFPVTFSSTSTTNSPGFFLVDTGTDGITSPRCGIYVKGHIS